MEKAKKRRLEKKGWRIGSAAEFLDLTPEEIRYIELKHALGDHLKSRRRSRRLSQETLAKLLSSSQSRVAKMEAADPSVSLDIPLCTSGCLPLRRTWMCSSTLNRSMAQATRST